MGVNCIILGGNNRYNRGNGDDVKLHVPRMKHAGPHRIATELRQHGFTVQVIDVGRFESFTKMLHDIVKKFVSKETLWVGFSTNFMYRILGAPILTSKKQIAHYRNLYGDFDKEVKKLQIACKLINPKIRLVTGGINAVDLSSLGFYHFRGHVENEIVEFTKECASGTLAEKRQFIVNKEFSGFPQSSILWQDQDLILRDRSLPIEVSRGCIFNCKFCSFPLRNKSKGDHIKDYAVLYDEMVYNYERWGITHYVFADDTFNDSVDKLTGLYNNVFSRLPFKLTFSAYIRLDLLVRRPETVDILYDSGLRSAQFGMETTKIETAKSIGKGLDPAVQIDFCRELAETRKDLVMASNYIVGLPYMDKQENLDMLDWLNSDDNPIHHVSLTPLYIFDPDLGTDRTYSSEFDLNYAKYGYETYLDETGQSSWKLSNGMTYDWAKSALVDFYLDSRWESRKGSRVGGFFYSNWVNVGVSESDLSNLTMSEMNEKYDVVDIDANREAAYYKDLLALDV